MNPETSARRFESVKQDAIRLAQERGKPQRVMDTWGNFRIVEATPNFSGRSHGVAWPDGRFEWE